MWDSSYAAYVSFFHVEKTQRHPVMNVFIDIIRQRMREKRKWKLKLRMNDSPDQVNEKRTSARFRWALAYTLIHNEQLKRYRKYRLRSTITVQSRTLERLFR